MFFVYMKVYYQVWVLTIRRDLIVLEVHKINIQIGF